MPARIEEQAATWAVRHPLAEDEERALHAWLAADRRHAGALLRAQAALSSIGRALAPVAETPIVRSGTFSRRRLLGGVAGALAASIAGIVGWSSLRGERVATGRGEIRRLPLADGSIAAIDADSELRVVLAREDRRIALVRGQAWFQVAKDRRRPFIVDAGLAHARAVGTAFSVQRGEGSVRIAVTEGIVAVWATDASGAMSILHAGDYATFVMGEAAPRIGRAPAAIERSLAWRDGEVSLEGETLGEAVAVFNRYNRQQMVLDDEALGRERLVGLFQINNPADFAATLEATLELTATTTPGEIRLGRKKHPPS